MLNGNDLELLSAYLDGALSDEERTALEARLQTDADLRRELARLRATVEMIKTLPTLPAPRPLTLTPRMVRRPNILTSAAFSAMSAAAAIILLVIGAVLFTTTRPSAVPAARQLVALAPTSQQQGEPEANQPQSAEANNAIQPPLAADNLQATMLKNSTQVGQEASSALDFAAVPTETSQSTAPALLFAAVSPAETLSAEELQADGSVAQLQQAAIDQQRTQADTAAPSAAMGGMASAAQAPLPAPTLALPTPTLLPTETATPTPSETATPTDTATMTSTASPAPTLIPTPVPLEAPASDRSTFGVGLIVVALVLFGFAIVTTILRRRS